MKIIRQYIGEDKKEEVSNDMFLQSTETAGYYAKGTAFDSLKAGGNIRTQFAIFTIEFAPQDPVITATLRLTKKVHGADYETYKGGGICTYTDNRTAEQFYFGWRDKGAISYPVGEAIQRSLVLFNRYKYTHVTLIVEADLTEERKEMTLIIKPI